MTFPKRKRMIDMKGNTGPGFLIPEEVEGTSGIEKPQKCKDFLIIAHTYFQVIEKEFGILLRFSTDLSSVRWEPA
jgi:hypothetical protein